MTKIRKETEYFTALELAKMDLQKESQIPDLYRSSKHLIYSSPATLAFNSPGAEGFGVKRAGLSVPDSVMLIVAPGCCGRNTSCISELPGYEGRFFYLVMDETDLITGRHLKKIPKAVEKLCAELESAPSVVMICITCVDALLGTDMERVCRKAEELVNLPVKPCYMYALTREGRRPPMVHVRQSIYSLLTPRKKNRRAVNLLGFFAPLYDDCELYPLLQQMGMQDIREISRCKDYEEFQKMSEANFSIILHHEARPAALDMDKNLQIPAIELQRLYQVDQIKKQYAALGKVFGVNFDDEVYFQQAKAAMQAFRNKYPDCVFALGEGMNGNVFELAVALIRYGFQVREIFGTPSPESAIYLRYLAALSPETRVYSNLAPQMYHYQSQGDVNITIGRDAGYYHPECPNLPWISDRQPYGYMGVKALFEALESIMESDAADVKYDSLVRLGVDVQEKKKGAGNKTHMAETKRVKGYRRVLTPFAPDQSGAVSVLYDMGGITVICDAGGCTGNICGFDEPRWISSKSAIFSAGLRDMDAIMGRDKQLVEKLSAATESIDATFAAMIGTPVPAVIATDYLALKRMAEKKTKLPILTIDTDGMELYDVGVEKAYLELFRTFASDKIYSNGDLERTCSNHFGDDVSVHEKVIGVLGATPFDLGTEKNKVKLEKILLAQGYDRVVFYGMGADIEDVKKAGLAVKNLVIAPGGLEAAKYLEKKYGTPYETGNPLAEEMISSIVKEKSVHAAAEMQQKTGEASVVGKKALVLHQQVLANSLRKELQKLGAEQVIVASYFMMKKELKEEGDVQLRGEDDVTKLVNEKAFDLIIADPVIKGLIPDYTGAFMEVTHFAVSGKLTDESGNPLSGRRLLPGVRNPI